MLDLLNSLESNSNLEDKDQTKSLKSKARLFTADVEKRTEAVIDFKDFQTIYHKTGNTIPLENTGALLIHRWQD